MINLRIPTHANQERTKWPTLATLRRRHHKTPSSHPPSRAILCSEMGMVFGRTGVAEPPFRLVLQTQVYEVRSYDSLVGIETIMNDESNGFRSLASYIGVMGNPKNENNQPIAMTAPVAMSGTSVRTMRFYLPEEYKTVGEAPIPSQANVKLVQIPAKSGAAIRFSGWVKKADEKSQLAKLLTALAKDGVTIDSDFAEEHAETFQYNPPFTIPQLRRNEMFLQLTEEQIQTLLKNNKGSEL